MTAGCAACRRPCACSRISAADSHAAPECRHLRTIRSGEVKGLTDRALGRSKCRRSAAGPAQTAPDNEDQRRQRAQSRLDARDPARHRRPRSLRAARLRQHADLSRLDRALSATRRISCQRKAHVSPTARKGTPTTEALEDAWTRDRRRGRRRCWCRPGSRRSRPRCCRCLQGRRSPAGHGFASTGRRGISATRVLKRFGVETTYYDPLIGAGIARLIQPNTRAVFTEAPGSLSFEMQDIPAIAAVAHARDAIVLMDNTWATPLFFRRMRKRRRHLDPGRHQISRRRIPT